MTNRHNIVVAGGGFAGLEAAFLLRTKVGGRARITLVSDREEFLFKPNTIYVPFGADPRSLLIPLGPPTAKRGIDFVQATIEGVDSKARVVSTTGGTLPYDSLVIATGATMRPEEIPGLAEHAETIWTADEMLSLGRRLQDVVERSRAGERQTIVFAVPPNNKCAGPLYEMVFMVETWLRRQRARDRVKLVYTTYERSYIQAFGPKLHDVVLEEFGKREITGMTGVALADVGVRSARYADGTTLKFDLLVAFPPYAAAVEYEGLPADDRGFLRTVGESREVVGTPGVYAPGDAGDFPVKQAFLAFLQADAAAEHIAASIEGRAASFGFDPVSMCVMEALDKATFAQVPLRATGDPLRPVEVRPSANGDYRVGVSPAWRLGKKLLGLYLPFRFRAGLPFHAGAPWKAMELGLRGMSATLARR